MYKAVVVFALLLFVKVLATPLPQTRPQEITVINLEEPCVRQGGMCERTENCHPSDIVQLSVNLCPQQSHLGVVCCYV